MVIRYFYGYRIYGYSDMLFRGCGYRFYDDRECNYKFYGGGFFIIKDLW